MRRQIYWLVLCCAFGLLFISGAYAETTCMATVAPFATAPTIDGKLSPGEWDAAVRTVGFQDIVGGIFTDARMGTCYFGFTGEKLYFAMVSEMPPTGQLAANVKNRDAELIWDEGIEIWLDPNRDNRASGEGDLRYYNYMGNRIGTILDVRYDPKQGVPDKGWNAGWETGNSLDPAAGGWVTEISVPVADLGMKPGDIIGRSIGVLMARNYKVGGWLQATWFPHEGSFTSWFAYPRIFLTKDSPSVAIESLGDKLFTGLMSMKAHVFNPGPARQVKVNLSITSSDMPELKDEKVLELPANGSASYTLDVPEGRFHEMANHAMTMTVQSPDGSIPYFNYNMRWKKAPEKKWPDVFTGPKPEDAFKLAYYPSYKFIRLFIDPRELGKEVEKSTSAKVTLTAPNGNILLTRTLTWKNLPSEQQITVPDLPNGEYTVTVKLTAYKDPLVRKFTREHFPWENNTLGITDNIYPPFTPVVVKKNTVGVVLRTYEVSGLGLWDSIYAKDREILAGPIVLKANEGQVLQGRGKFTVKKPTAATYEGKAVVPGVQIATRCTTEYDGCMKVEMTLQPDKKRQVLNALWLEIPIKDAEAKLFHVSTTSLRDNPAGATPAGNGSVWDSRQFPDGDWYGNFKPYIWLGGEERGICWFADNDKGWELSVDQKNPDKSVPCLALYRANGVLTLRVNLIQKPTTLTGPRKIVFGLMASPAKPLMENWRNITFGGYGKEGYRTINWMGSEYWGADQSFSSKYPRNGDLSILDAMRDLRLGKKIDNQAFIKAFDERNFKPGMPTSKSREDILNLLNVSLNVAAGARPGNYLNVYWDEFHSTDWLHKEIATFKNEWSGTYDYGSIGGLVPSHRDFAVWYAAEFIKRGIGLYFDNAYPKRATDLLTTNAYRLPNGDIQPSAGMWAHREYLKRIWIIHQELGPKDIMPIMMIHMTNTHIIPYMVWNQTNLDLEWFYGPTPAQSKYPHELLRAESLGLQSGNIPLALARCDGGKTAEEQKIAGRTRFGALMVHEIRPDANDGPAGRPLMNALYDFGYGKSDCQVYNYWQDHYPVVVSNDQVKSLLLKRNGELLLLLCTWNNKPEVVSFSLDNKALGVTPAMVTDIESNETYTMKENAVQLPLESYGVRLLRIK